MLYFIWFTGCAFVVGGCTIRIEPLTPTKPVKHSGRHRAQPHETPTPKPTPKPFRRKPLQLEPVSKPTPTIQLSPTVLRIHPMDLYLG
jgi:putative hemolysin